MSALFRRAACGASAAMRLDALLQPRRPAHRPPARWFRKPRCCIVGRIQHGRRQQHLARRQLAHGAHHQRGLARRHRKTQPGNRRAKAGRCRRPAGCRSSWQSPRPRPCSCPRSAPRWARRSRAWPAGRPRHRFHGSRAGWLRSKRKPAYSAMSPPAQKWPPSPAHQHAAHIAALLDGLKHGAQLAPHRARHGVELAGMRQRDRGQRSPISTRTAPLINP